jgi:hypothetical protein
MDLVSVAEAASAGEANLAAAPLAEGFDFPTSVGCDEEGIVYVAESGLPFGGARPGGRIVRIDAAGGRTVALADLRAPVNGLTWHAG